MPSPQNEAAPLVVDKLSFQYRSRSEPALDDISFTLQPGEVLLVAGASGSGKTTLVRCVNGLIPRSYSGELKGEVRLHGVDAKTYSLAQISQIVGTVLQDPEKQILGAHVKSEVAFGPENLGLSFEEVGQRVTEALQRLGLEHLRDRETFSLSGGEKQKVALAGALAMRPSVLLLDEPLASLDPASAREALATFRGLADLGAAILLIEHRVEDALAARPDRVLYIKDAHIHYLGPPEDLSDAVDWREVKLPAPQTIRLIRAQKKEAGRAATPGAEAKSPAAVRSVSSGRQPPLDRKDLVKFENVSFNYDEGDTVLHDINLEIGAGERVAFLGPNGAGKSTLVKHAIGLLKPRQGRVLIAGKDTRQMSVAQVARTVGYVFQSPGHMLFAPTVREELGFGPRNIGQSDDEVVRNVAEAVVDLNLDGMEEYAPLALSFGQQKRVTIACVAAMCSRILALDEPTAGQDFGNYMGFMDTLLGRDGNGADAAPAAPLSRFDALIFITHDLDLAVIYASRVILLADGRIAADGPPEQVLADSALLERCRIVPTSLLAENLRLLPKTGKFLRVEGLAALAA